jgi:tetratricopeptide (TPR) repeat protein
MKRILGIAMVGLMVIALNLDAAEKRKLAGPLLDGLGRLNFPISTKSTLAQRYFNQGLTLTYAFNHQESIRSYRSAAMADPHCAMAFWGVAYAFGPHVNKPMNEADNAEAWTALQKALSLKSTGTPKETALIEALAHRYEKIHKEDRSALDRAYADRMRELAKQFPDDLDIQTLFAEALMDTMPWDYWLKGTPKRETVEALAALKFVLSRDPDHPGANHFYIHALEAGPQPELGLPSADSLMKFAPSAGHLVHMPSHIYMRVGQYNDAVLSNEKAVKADRDYLRQTRAQGFYPGVYYPHNIHFLWWAQLYTGRSKEALKTANKAADYAVDNYCGPSKALEAPRFRHLPWITMMRFGRWNDVLAVRKPAMTNDFLLDRAIWHFTRGIAFAAKKDTQNAAREHAELKKISKSAQAKQLDHPGLPVTSIMAISELWLAARVAENNGDQKAMTEAFLKAIKLEDEMPYMEPAYWPLYVRSAYGAALLRSNQPAEAEQIFRKDLQKLPRNGWGLFGLEQSLLAQGKDDAADVVHRQFNRGWSNADVRLQLDWF